MEKHDINPMDPTARLSAAPRCTATAKSTGRRCRSPAVKGWKVCRLHGARGGHPAGSTHPSWTHGGRSREAQEMRKAINDLVRVQRDLEKLIE